MKKKKLIKAATKGKFWSETVPAFEKIAKKHDKMFAKANKTKLYSFGS